MANMNLQLYLINVSACVRVYSLNIRMHLSTYLPADLFLYELTDCECVSLSASCHLRWCDSVFRPIKLTGEAHLTYALHSAN